MGHPAPEDRRHPPSGGSTALGAARLLLSAQC